MIVEVSLLVNRSYVLSLTLCGVGGAWLVSRNDNIIDPSAIPRRPARANRGSGGVL